ncbi:MAG: hypothetical protein WC523_03945 [Patescibacteria group bacterium]
MLKNRLKYFWDGTILMFIENGEQARSMYNRYDYENILKYFIKDKNIQKDC